MLGSKKACQQEQFWNTFWLHFAEPIHMTLFWLNFVGRVLFHFGARISGLWSQTRGPVKCVFSCSLFLMFFCVDDLCGALRSQTWSPMKMCERLPCQCLNVVIPFLRIHVFRFASERCCGINCALYNVHMASLAQFFGLNPRFVSLL